jgi:dTDP-glucose 4,6-dehydratase
LEYVRVAKPVSFIHFSTDEVYGSAPKDSKGHKEWSPILPSNPYSASKACQEALAIAWWRSFGIPLIITNTMNNFGEMQAPSKFPAMIQTKLENDETITIHASPSGEVGTRYYIHSRNSADAIVFILQNVKPVIHVHGEIDRPIRLNIVGDKQVSNEELVDTIARLMDKVPKKELMYFHSDNPGHDLHYGLDGELLASLGWKSPVPFEESLKNTIEWQQANPKWML